MIGLPNHSILRTAASMGTVLIAAAADRLCLGASREAPHMSTNSFRLRKLEDHEIVNGCNQVVWHVRVKPSGVLESPKNGKIGHGVFLQGFGSFVSANGKGQAQ